LQAKLDSVTSYVYFILMMTRKIPDTAVSDLAHSIGLLVRRWRAAAPSQELSWTESLVMARLAKDGAATTADLARAEAMKPQSMGTTIAALEKLGFVERKPHPTDGRQININLTPKGAAMRKNAKDAKLTWLKHAIAELDEEERKTLFKAGAIIKRLAEK
jgi:DNA-binding MarR family transcriptional regulator